MYEQFLKQSQHTQRIELYVLEVTRLSVIPLGTGPGFRRIQEEKDNGPNPAASRGNENFAIAQKGAELVPELDSNSKPIEINRNLSTDFQQALDQAPNDHDILSVSYKLVNRINVWQAICAT